VRTSLLVLFLFFTASLIAQTTDTLSVEQKGQLVVKDSVSNIEYDPLAPSKAAFYSAVLPGLGQAYNKRYWKIPIVYAGIGTGIYFYIQNNEDYNRFRDAYKRRLAGFEDDEFQGISTDRLIDAQKNASRNRDVSLIVAIGFYVLNIVDANVDAHLRQFNVSQNLSMEPRLQLDPFNAQTTYGMAFTLNIE